MVPLSHVFIVVSMPTLATVLKSCLGRSAPEEVVAVRAKERSVRSKRAMAPVQRVYSVRIQLATTKRKIEKSCNFNLWQPIQKETTSDSDSSHSESSFGSDESEEEDGAYEKEDIESCCTNMTGNRILQMGGFANVVRTNF